MKLAWFGVEEWLNPMDSLARINLGSSCVSALRMDELFDLTGEDLDAFLNEMRTMPALSPRRRHRLPPDQGGGGRHLPQGQCEARGSHDHPRRHRRQ